MRNRALIVAGVVLVAAAAFAAGSIISSFRSPSEYVSGMAYHSPYLYHGSQRTVNINVTTTTGSLVRRIRALTAIWDVDFTGTYFWVSTWTSPYWVYRLTSTGSVMGSFRGPARGYGITYDGRYLWYSSPDAGNMVWQLTTAGSVVSSFKGPGSYNGGLDWDSRGYLWLCDWPGSGGGVFRMTTVGSVVESYRPIPAGRRPSGCAWDGNYVWYCTYNSRYVYQLDTVITSIVPASLGKVKALFR